MPSGQCAYCIEKATPDHLPCTTMRSYLDAPWIEHLYELIQAAMREQHTVSATLSEPYGYGITNKILLESQRHSQAPYRTGLGYCMYILHSVYSSLTFIRYLIPVLPFGMYLGTFSRIRSTSSCKCLSGLQLHTRLPPMAFRYKV